MQVNVLNTKSRVVLKRSIVILSALILQLNLVHAQNYFQKATKLRIDRNYNDAITMFKLAIDQYTSEGKIDSTLLSYENIQTCYLNTFKIDSAYVYLSKGADYAFEFNKKDEHLDFLMAMAELKVMVNKIPTADSLFHVLLERSEEYPGHKARALYRLSNIAYYDLDSATAFRYINEAYDIATENKDSSILGNILGTKAILENEFGNKRKAIDYHLQSIPLFKKEAIGEPSAYRKIANIFFSLKDYPNAEKYALLSLEKSRAKKYLLEESKCLLVLADIYLLKRDCEKATEMLERSIEIDKLKKSKAHLTLSYSLLAKCNMESGDFTLAEEALQNAYAHYKSSYPKYKFNYHHVKAYLDFNLGRDKELLSEINKCEKLSTAHVITDDELKLFRMKIWYAKLTDNKEETISLLEQYQLKKDSIYNITQANNVRELEAKYMQAENQKEIEFLNAENRYKESILKQKNIMIFGSLLGLIFLTLLSFFSLKLTKKVKEQNQIISDALKVKDTLLREIHHRVKNNLQVISSMLYLQSRYIKDTEAINALQQGQDRVHSMALIHRDLYETESLTGVNTKSYTKQLTDKLADSYSINKEKVEIILDVDDLILDLDTMIPLGLIINELASNAFKHAFDDNTTHPQLKIALKEENNRIILRVSDNGKGIENVNDLEGKSFGYEIINAFVDKLEAEMKIESNAGLSVEISINDYVKID